MRGRSHLHQRLLHGGPVGHPPSTLQDEIRVYVTFGLAVFRQGFPLVQFLRAPRRPGSREQKLLSTNQQIHERAGTVIHFPSTEERKHRRPERWALWDARLDSGQGHLPSKRNYTPGTPSTTHRTAESSAHHSHCFSNRHFEFLKTLKLFADFCLFFFPWDHKESNKVPF